MFAALGLAACGDDEGTSTVASTSSTTPTTSTTTAAADGPLGEMTPDGIGAIQQGASPEEVVAELGEPDSEEDLPGCELDPQAPALLQYIYELEGGRLAISFDAETDQMTSYFTDSPELATDHGDRVGDSWEALVDSWGPALDPVVLGSAKPTPGEGPYKVGPDGENQLLFELQGQRLRRISGGFLPICE